MILTIASKYILILSILFLIKYFVKVIMKIFIDDLTPLSLRWYHELLLFLAITYIITYAIIK
jgi:hypothetical protein